MLTLDGKNWWRGPDVCRTLPERIATLASIAYSMWYTHGNRELSRAPLEAYRSVWRMAVRAEDKGGWNEDDWIEVQRRLAHGGEMTEYIWDAAHDDEGLEDVWDADGIRWLESACDPFGLPPRMRVRAKGRNEHETQGTRTNDMEKLDPRKDGASMDIVAENVERMREWFPEVFTEGRVDCEALCEVLGEYAEDKQERYSFTWHGKSRARRIAQSPSTGTLLPCPEESVDWDTTKNIFIEGDNLEVLKLLQKSYHRRVKMIYIDPPYNTGHEFIYPDKYQDNLQTYLQYSGQVDGNGLKLSANAEVGGRYHTNWLNMMYPRLKLARNLLAASGAIFVSIDDHEQHNLRQIMDEIFGSENFVSSIAWQKVFAKKNKALVSGSHDHILLYARDLDSWSRNLLPRDETQLSAFRNPDNDPRGRWQSVSFSVQSEDSQRRLAYRYKIKLPSGREVGPPPGRHWNGLAEKMESLRADNRLWFGENGDSPPRVKVFLSEVQAGIVPDTWWTHEDTGNNQEAKKEILALLGEAEPFSTPKPTRLIQRMLQIATTPNAHDLVLDFFAGSGSTGHAVMEQNRGDGGNRRFILVQLPEPTGSREYSTISEVCRARITAAKQRTFEDANGASTGASGFRAFALARSNIRSWQPDADALDDALLDAVDNIELGRTEDDLLYELLLKYGLDLAIPLESRTVNGKKVYVIGAGALVVCLATDVTLDVVEGIAALKDELKPEVMRVVFRDAGFADDVVKTNTVQILRQAGIEDVKSL